MQMTSLNKAVLLSFFLFWLMKVENGHAQEITFDAEHAGNVQKNHVARTAAEATVKSYNEAMLQDFKAANESLLRFTAAKEMVYSSLTEVNNLLRDGKQAKLISRLVVQVTKNTNRLRKAVGPDPAYLPFANKTIEYMTVQAVGLAEEVRSVVLNPQVLMEHKQRDRLLQNILFRLRMISASLSSICNTIEYTKSKGFWKAANPFQNYIDRDRVVIQDIIRKAGYLKR